MDEIILSYALIETCNETNIDLFSHFRPLVLQKLDKDQSKPPSVLRKEIKEKSGISIPTYIIQGVCESLYKDDYCDRMINQKESSGEKWYHLTEKGDHFNQNVLTRIRTLEIELDNLYSNIINYINIQSKNTIPDLSQELIKEKLTQLITNNIVIFIHFYNPNKPQNLLQDINDLEKRVGSSDVSNNIDVFIIRFLLTVEKEKSSNPNHLVVEKLIKGSTIFSILFSKSKAKNALFFDENFFKNLTIFLDTNFILSIFYMHKKTQCDESMELFKLIKSYNIKIKVFDFTVFEIKNLLQNYTSWENNLIKKGTKKYPSESLFQEMRSNGWDKMGVEIFINNPKNDFDKKGIQIEDTINIIPLKDYIPDNVDLYNKYKQFKQNFKPHISEIPVKHDFAAIKQIQLKRNGKKYNMTDVDYVFLSSDKMLTYFNFFVFGHRDNHTISEVFLDIDLMKLLYINDPKIDIDVTHIVCSYVRDNFEIFKNFYEIFEHSDIIDETVVQNHLVRNVYDTSLLNEYDPESSTIDIAEGEKTELKLNDDVTNPHQTPSSNTSLLQIETHALPFLPAFILIYALINIIIILILYIFNFLSLQLIILLIISLPIAFVGIILSLNIYNSRERSRKWLENFLNKFTIIKK